MMKYKINVTKLAPEKRLLLATLLIESGYCVNLNCRKIPNGKSSKFEYSVNFEEVKGNE
jgi:hypothetical protein